MEKTFYCKTYSTVYTIFYSDDPNFDEELDEDGNTTYGCEYVVSYDKNEAIGIGKAILSFNIASYVSIYETILEGENEEDYNYDSSVNCVWDGYSMFEEESQLVS